MTTMNDDINDTDERTKMMALSAAMGAGHQFMKLMEDEIEEREPPKSTGKSRMEAVVARRKANWTKARKVDVDE
jgi:hypothetical protein